MLNRIATIIGTILIISLSLMALPINVAVGASPEVKPIPRQYILEGDELELVIEASDWHRYSSLDNRFQRSQLIRRIPLQFDFLGR